MTLEAMIKELRELLTPETNKVRVKVSRKFQTGGEVGDLILIENPLSGETEIVLVPEWAEEEK